MKLSRIVIAVCVLVLIFGGVALSKQFGWWETKSSKAPRKIQEGEFAGESNPLDIRGSYTFGDIEAAFDIDSATLAKAFGVESDSPSDIQVKLLEELYEDKGFPVEIGTNSVRYFTALYAGLPSDDTSGITKQALKILIDEGKIDKELYDTLMADAIDLDTVYEVPEAHAVDGTENTEIEEEHESANQVSGSTTIQQALALGIPEDFLKEQIGSYSSTSLTVREVVQGNGLSFGDVRTILNDYIGE